jgi:uncharacterized membrane protein YphA (DoxX/SURF4 family)
MRLRENKIEIQGRSMLLNVLAIILNVLGVFFIAKGFHQSAGDSAMMYKIVGLLLFLSGLTSVIALKGMFMFSYVARAFVGGLFIVSGLVKANDPWGFAFKLEEYFSPMGLAYDFPFFEHFSPYVLELSILVCIAEIVLGVAVIVGGKIKLTAWLLVLMMLFFSWLTYYTYSCVEANELLREAGMVADRECVTDCGCFGDALRGSVGRSLTPYESFWKDLILFYFVLVIFFNQRKIEMNTYKENWVMAPAALLVVIFFSWVFGWYFPILFYIITILGAFVLGNMNIGKIAKPWKMAIFVSIATLLFSLYTTNYLPIKDYRAYAIGNNIVEQMNNGSAEIADYELVYKNKETGENESFAIADYAIYGDTTKYVFVDRKTTIIEAGKPASISDFTLTTDYEKLTDSEKKNPKLDSIIMYDFESYYEPKLVVTSKFGVDTINKYDYIPYYVDSTNLGDTVFYSKGNEFYGLLDPTTPFEVDVTSYILSLEKVILVTIRDITAYNKNAINDLLDVYSSAKTTNIPFYILTPASDAQMKQFYENTGLDAPYLSIDGVEVKIIVRSNPGLILLEKGTVIEKFGSKSIPGFEKLMEKY